MRWAGRVSSRGGGEAYTGVWWGNVSERDHLVDPGVNGKTIIRWSFREWNLEIWTG